MRIVEVDDDNTATVNIYNIPDLQVKKEDYSEVLEYISTNMQFHKNFYTDLYNFVGHNDLSVFNKNQIVHKVELPVEGYL